MNSLPMALTAYRGVLSRIASGIRNQGSEPVFMAQVVQATFDSQQQRDRLWMGKLNDGQEYRSEQQYPVLLEQYNLALQQVSNESNAHFIDLPKLVPTDATLFLDGMHFNEYGTQQVARVVADFFEDEVLDQ